MKGNTAADVWARVDKNGPVHPVLGTACWIWTGARLQGYGRIRFGGVTWRAHRLVFKLVNNDSPEVVQHACDRPSCVRPDHLVGGTVATNNADMMAKGRHATGEACARNRPTGDRHGTKTKPWSVIRGEDHYAARLTEAAVQAIRCEYQGDVRQVDLAAKYGISQSHVSSIVRNEKWRSAGHEERTDGNETNAAPQEQPMAKSNGERPVKVTKFPKHTKVKAGPERTLARTTHELPVKLDQAELAAAGIRLAGMLENQGAFDRHAREVKAGIKTQEDALQAKVDEAAAVIRSGEEIRKVEVEIRADFRTGMVAVVRLDTSATVTTRKLTDDERQQKLVLDDADEDAGADEEPESSTPPLNTKALWNVGSNGVERSPLPDGQL